MENTPGAASLPIQAVTTLQEKIEQVRQQQELLSQMRASGNPTLLKQADELQQQYHVRDMAELAGDVYASAAHRPASPGLGWIRASEHPELLRERLGVNWTDQQIADYLQPLHSDFRAEIYLPDPRVYGPDVLPVIANKGSNGLIAVPDSHGGTQYRESALEDWIENARQGVGLESDHADRAMRLATAFGKDYQKPFETTGHSKGAPEASASARITGMSSYVFNAAGEHTNTATRFVKQHGGTLHNDVQIHSYYVKGEVLHDVQQGVHDMGGLTRFQLGLAAQQFAELGSLPDVHALAKGQLANALPYDPKMQHDALQLIDYLGTHSGPHSLKEMPLAAGERQIELPAKTRDAEGRLVDRPSQPSLGDIGGAAGPLVDVISGALIGGVIGKQTGEPVVANGRIVDGVIRGAGSRMQRSVEVYGYVLNDQLQGHGRLVAGAMHYGGAAAADLRMAYGQAESLGERGLGALARWSNAVSGAIDRAESHLPFMSGLEATADANDRATIRYVEQKQAAAEQHQHEAQRDAQAIRTFADTGAATVVQVSTAAGQSWQRGTERVGANIVEGAKTAGASVRTLTDRVPEVGAAIGAVGGGVTVAVTEWASAPLETLTQSKYALQQGGGAIREAVDRHGVQAVVLPSLDAHTRVLESEAVALLHQQQTLPAHDRQTALTPEQNPHAFVQRMLDSARSGDWSAFRGDTQTLASMAPGRELLAQAVAQVDQHQMVQQQSLDQQQASQLPATRGMGR